MTDYSARMAAALAMQSACVAACEASAPDKRSDSYRQSADRERAMARVCSSIDPVNVLAALDDAPPMTLNERQAFEQAAVMQHFNVQKNDSGDYFYPITDRAYKVWQMAIKFKEGK